MDLMTDAQVTKVVLRIRHHNNIAHNASLEWQRRKRWLREYIKQNIANYQSDGAKRRKVSEDWQLEDAMAEWNWHRREAGRLTVMLMLELTLRGDNVTVDSSRLDAISAAVQSGY